MRQIHRAGVVRQVHRAGIVRQIHRAGVVRQVHRVGIVRQIHRAGVVRQVHRAGIVRQIHRAGVVRQVHRALVLPDGFLLLLLFSLLCRTRQAICVLLSLALPTHNTCLTLGMAKNPRKTQVFVCSSSTRTHERAYASL